MDVALITAQLLLAGVFAVAGFSKLLDRAGAREAFSAFQLPSRLRPILGWALPGMEILVAVALVPRSSSWWAGLAALGLLLMFTAVIMRSLVQGKRPDCRCFGQLRATPVGWPTVARNGLLIFLAVFLVGAGWNERISGSMGRIPTRPPDDRLAVILGSITAVLLIVVIAMLVGILLKQTRLGLRLDAIEARLEEAAGSPSERPEAVPPDRGLPIGAPAPAFALPDLRGALRSLADLLADGRPVLLLFVAYDCQPCTALTPNISTWRRQHANTVTVVLVSRGSAEHNRAKFEDLAVPVLLQAATEVADAYGAQWTPAAVLIAPTGRLASHVTYGDVAIGSLVTHATAAPGPTVPESATDRNRRRSLPVVAQGPARLGHIAPPIALPDLHARTVDLRDYRGQDTLVVFWNPDCVYCQQLADDLRRWETEPFLGAPRLLVVASGSAEANRAVGFRSPVVLDAGSTIAKAFGVESTPSAVLIDAEGRIASSVGTGARDVLALAGWARAVESPDIPRDASL